jgi:hypothetical protein
MKKYFPLILALLVMLALCACDGSGNGPSLPATTPSAAPTDATEPPTEHIHSYEVTQQDATCTVDGAIIHTCICGDSHSEPIPAEGHVFGNWTIIERPTMIETGISQRICTKCEFQQTIETPVNTLEQEIQGFMDDYLDGLPVFSSAKKMSGGTVFGWVTWNIPTVSWEMDENYLITIVYSMDVMDEFTERYLGQVYDYTYLAEPNKDFMTFDLENRLITILTGGAGGGGYNYSIEELTEKGENHYTLRYLAVDPYMEDAFANGFYHYGDLEFKIVDGHLQILSHSEQTPQ